MASLGEHARAAQAYEAIRLTLGACQGLAPTLKTAAVEDRLSDDTLAIMASILKHSEERRIAGGLLYNAAKSFPTLQVFETWLLRWRTFSRRTLNSADLSNLAQGLIQRDWPATPGPRATAAITDGLSSQGW